MGVKESFIGLFRANIHRDGAEELLQMLEESDFFTAPASTKFHGACEGGLAQHSINVHRCLAEKAASFPNGVLNGISSETLAIVSLLHDVCKIGCYKSDLKNVKNELGQWVKVPYYVHDDSNPYGHGEKSVDMIRDFMKLTEEEKYAIRWHMGPYTGEKDWQNFGKSVEKYPLVLALFEADMEATHLLETENA